jgi:hypothetical protein
MKLTHPQSTLMMAKKTGRRLTEMAALTRTYTVAKLKVTPQATAVLKGMRVQMVFALMI